MIAAFSIALLLQLVGTLVVAFEVWQAHTRWTTRFGPQEVSGSFTATLPAVTGRFVGHYVPPDESTLEERVSMIEERQVAMQRSMAESIDTIPEKAAQSARDVEVRLQPQIAETLEYLAGQGDRPWWLPWWLGPGLLILGVLIGGVASVAAAA